MVLLMLLVTLAIKVNWLNQCVVGGYSNQLAVNKLSMSLLYLLSIATSVSLNTCSLDRKRGYTVLIGLLVLFGILQ